MFSIIAVDSVHTSGPLRLANDELPVACVSPGRRHLSALITYYFIAAIEEVWTMYFREGRGSEVTMTDAGNLTD